jgi:signal transduction histidine kinase/ligand-binding sensor domain-containing protein
MWTNRGLLILVCLFWSLLSELRAQPHALPVRRLGVDDGLPQGSVYSLFQDSRGFIWIGTGDGLARWDGRSFRTFRGRYNDSSGRSLAARIVRGPMCEDAHGRLWFSCSSGLVCYNFRGQRFSQIDLGPISYDEQIVIAGVDKSSVYCWLYKRIWKVDLRTLRAQPLPSGLAGDESITGGAMIGDQLWLATQHRLYHLNTRTAATGTVLQSDSIRATLPLTDGRLSVWLPGKVLLLRNGRPDSSIALPDSVSRLFHPIRVSNSGICFGYTDAGLAQYRFNTGRMLRFPVNTNPSYSLNSPYVVCLLMDRSDNLWVGTEGNGINIVDTKGNRFGSFIPQHGENADETALMAKSLLDVNGKLWIGTFNSGLLVLDRNTNQVRRYNNYGKTSLERVTLLHRDDSDRIWMNYEQILGIIDPQTMRFTRQTTLPDSNVRNLTATAMGELRDGSYMIGSTKGLFRLAAPPGGPLRITKITQPAGPGDGFVAAIQTMPDGSVFIGKVGDGFYRLRPDGDESSVRVLDHGLHHTGIRDFQLANKGHLLWMATENGLVAYEPLRRSYFTLDEHDGLSNSHIYGMLAESDSSIWISTNRGLNRVRYRFRDEESQLFIRSVDAWTVKDGLQSNEFNSGAYCRLDDGGMAFGGVAGVNWFHPKRVFNNPYPPQVVITSIMVNEKPLDAATDYPYLSRIRLPFDQSTLGFRFSALEFTNSSANRYEYFMQGFDPHWVYAGTIAEARYANLPPGDYRFMVRASNSDGIWSKPQTLLTICIIPPWWQQLWAQILGVLVLIASLALIIRAYVQRRMARQLRELEKQRAINDERIRISRDMHDELGTGLTKIALLTEVAQRRGGASQPASLSEIASTSRKLTEKIGEIVWTLNPANDTLDTLAAYIREFLQDNYDSLDEVLVTTDYPDTIPDIPMSHILRQALLLVTKEAINNAVKYSGASLITLRLRIEDETISFEVSDDGQGFDVEQACPRPGGGGNGLGNMKARLQAVGGSLEIHSTPGMGTRVLYQLPMRYVRSYN